MVDIMDTKMGRRLVLFGAILEGMEDVLEHINLEGGHDKPTGGNF